MFRISDCLPTVRDIADSYNSSIAVFDTVGIGAEPISAAINILKIGARIMFKRSCEDPSTLYVCLFGRRFIFRNKKYVGWYKP